MRIPELWKLQTKTRVFISSFLSSGWTLSVRAIDYMKKPFSQRTEIILQILWMHLFNWSESTLLMCLSWKKGYNIFKCFLDSLNTKHAPEIFHVVVWHGQDSYIFHVLLHSSVKWGKLYLFHRDAVKIKWFNIRNAFRVVPGTEFELNKYWLWSALLTSIFILSVTFV